CNVAPLHTHSFPTRRSSDLDELRQLADQHDSDFEPQALYWMGRAAELSQQPHARDVYVQLCQRYIYTYYCQLARERIDIPLSERSEEHTSELQSRVDLVCRL